MSPKQQRTHKTTGRQPTGEVLEKSEERFRRYFELGLIGMAITSPTKGIMEVNDQICAILGYERNELLHMTWAELTHPDDLTADVDQFNRVLAGEIDGYSVDKRWIRKDGQVIHSTISVKCLRHTNGSVDCFVALIQDITERVRAEEAVAESERQMQALVTSLDDIVFEFDEQGTYLNVWAADESLLAQPKAQLLGQRIDEALGEENGRPFVEAMKRVLASGHAESIEYPLEVIGGQRWFVARISPIFALDNSARTVSMVVRDITERKQAEAALRESEQRFRRLFTTSPDAILLIDPHDPDISWPIVDCNEAACQMNGYAREELIGQSIDILNVTIGTREERIAYLALIRRDGVVHSETIHRHRDGHLIPIEVSTSVINFDGRELVMGIDRDITERRQAEEALQESETRYRLATHATNDVIWEWNAKTHELIWTENAQLVFGYLPEEISHDEKWWDERIYPEDRERIVSKMDALIAGNESNWSDEYRFRRRDDSYAYISDRGYIEREASGEAIRMVGAMSDITERKRAEEALRESETRFRSLIENSSDEISIVNADGKLLYESPTADPTLGYQPGEFFGQNIFQLIHPDDLERVQEQFARLMQDPNLHPRDQFRLRHQDGNWRWVEAVGTNLLSEPSVRGIVINYHDITERKRAEAALVENEQRFRALTEHAPDGIVIYGSSGRIEYSSPATSRIMGYPVNEMINVDPAQITHPDDLPGLLLVLNELQQAPGKTIRTQYRMRHKDGSWRWLESNVSNFSGLPGIGGLVFNFRDISERKQAEDALQQSERKFRTLFEIAPVGISVTDMEHNIIDANYALQRITGLNRQELLGGAHRKRTYLRPDGSVMPAEEFASTRAVREDMPIFDIETGIVSEDRGVIWSQVSAAPLQTSDSAVVVITQDITERVQAERNIQQRNEDLLIINALNEAVNRGEDIEVIVEVFAHETRNVFACHDVAIYLLDQEAKYIEMQNSTLSRRATERIEKLIGRPIPKIRVPIREGGYFKRIMANEQGLMTSDPKEIQQWIEEFTETTFLPIVVRPVIRKIIPQIYKALNIGSTISIPLISSGRTIGILDMSSEGVFTEEDLRRIHSLSHQMTAVIMRKQAEKQVQLQLRRLSALSEIDRAISSSLDMRLSLDVVLSEVLSQLGVDAAAVLLLNESNLTLEYCAGKGFRTLAIRQLRTRLGDGFAGQVGLERKLLHVPGLAEASSQFPRADLLKNEGFVDYYGVPLVAKGLLKGVLEIFHRTPLNPNLEWVNYLETLGGQTAIAIDNAQLFEGMQKSNLELIAAYDATIAGWSHAMDLRDRETEGHSRRVTELTLILADRMGIHEQEQVHIRRGALLHDIGKLGVPDQILLKTGKLTEEEWASMRQHPTSAFEMLSPISYLRPALDIPYCHHEKWDGTGYPRGLRGEQIPLAARIFAVVDVWDALTSDRPYRPAWSKEKTLEYIKEQSGRHFDPNVVDVFLEAIVSV